MRIDKSHINEYEEAIEDGFNWGYVEREGRDTRFDWGSHCEKSMWLREDGEIEGQIPTHITSIINELAVELG